MDHKAKILERLITQKPEKYKEDNPEANNNELKIVWGTSGKYPDGTSWEKEATPEEIAEYENWAK